ncbi:MAG TPA: Fe-S cluster assembly protein SufD [Gemmatimonadales bacterium]|nr:Fe-S cluster assembly protein SufD [Gemmatimonadales bacterium]
MTQVYQGEIESRDAPVMAETSEWLDGLRRRAADRFAAVGFPTSRDEEWRFTPVAPIARTAWREAPASASVTLDQLGPYLFGHLEWTRLVFVNGVYRQELSSIPPAARGVRVGSLAQALRDGLPTLERHLGRQAGVESSPFTAMNTAVFQDGGFIQVPTNTELDHPFHLIFVSTDEAAACAVHPRNLLLVERGARASFIESYVTTGSAGNYWTNPVTEVVVDANCWVEHTRIQRESERAYHIGGTYVAQQRDSHYRSFSLSMGGALARHNLQACLNDENVETLLYGLYLTHRDQLVDNHTAIHHDQPNCRSWEVYKGILDDRSRAVFNGKVFVKPEAQKTDAKQTNRNLLLSDGARVDTKPQLEIFADDVKCTHGATVGRLDDIALFYARSRGVPAEEAQRLLTYAFAAEVIGEVALEPVRRELERLVKERLGAR